MVPPGVYQARLKIGDWSAGRTLHVRMDPRVVRQGTVSEDDVRVQTELALKVRDALSRARRLEEKLKGELEKRPDDPGLKGIHDLLNTASVRYSPPMLLDQLSYLYQNLKRADQRPGEDAVRRSRELERELKVLGERLEDLIRNAD